jgi:uncharacterized DUF497 family protein
MPGFLYEFEWDPVKAHANFRKHGVDFERAASVFLDPMALTVPDEEHSEAEARWITLERDAAARYVMVVHTFELTNDQAWIRLISHEDQPSRKSATTRSSDETRIRFQQRGT